MSAHILSSSTWCLEWDLGYEGDRSAPPSSSRDPWLSSAHDTLVGSPASSETAWSLSPDDPDFGSDGWPSDGEQRYDLGRRALDGGGLVRGPDEGEEGGEDSAYEAEEGWRPESPSEEEGDSDSEEEEEEEGFWDRLGLHAMKL